MESDKKVSCHYELDIGFPVGGYGWFSSAQQREIDDVLYAKLGFSDSSGAGFGVRDHQWQFTTRLEAEHAEAIVLDLFREKHFPIDGDAACSGCTHVDHAYTGITHLHWSNDWSDDEVELQMYPDEDCPVVAG